MAFSFEFKKLRFFDPVLDEELNQQPGAVGKYLTRIGELMVIGAKRQVGVDSGALRNSIHMVHDRTGQFQNIWIGSNLPYAYDHHEGTAPHWITVTNHRMMRFTNGGRVIYTNRVLHPGTQPNRFLSDQLYLVRV